MKKNKIIIAGRETGKTTFLLNEIDKYINQGKNVIILDSATEHEDKSLLKKIINKYKDAIVFDMQDVNKVVLNKMDVNTFIKGFKQYFPFEEVLKTTNNILCFDLSYFLEKGHDVYEETCDEKKYNYYRNLYNFLSLQITLSLILSAKEKILTECVVIMDEIEFPRMNYDMFIIQENIEFIASVHPENAFGTFYKEFEEMDFKPYIKRKED